MKRYKRRRRFKVKKLFILLFIVMLCAMAGKFLNSFFTMPFLGSITHHIASEDNGWNLILVNRDNYIPADYKVQLTELSNGKKVDSRIYPELQEMFDDARAQGYSLYQGAIHILYSLSDYKLDSIGGFLYVTDKIFVNRK